MKKLLLVMLAFGHGIASAATTVPVQLLNPSGSSVGQAIISSGPSSPPNWGNLAVANVTGAAKSGANTDITSLASPSLGGATATTQAVGTNNTTVATTAFVATALGSAAGGRPYFRASENGGQTLTANTPTKIAFNIEQYDSNSRYDNTLYRFTPNVAGLYRVTVNIIYTMVSAGGVYGAYIYKNGTQQALTPQYVAGTAGQVWGVSVTDIVQMNGTTDYLEGWGQTPGTAMSNGAFNTYFEAFYIGP